MAGVQVYDHNGSRYVNLDAPPGTCLVTAATRIRTASGELALDGSNPTPVTTGLSRIDAACVTLKGTAAPGVGTSVLTYTQVGGTLNVYAWKVTATGDCTLVASTGTETFSWMADGG